MTRGRDSANCSRATCDDAGESDLALARTDRDSGRGRRVALAPRCCFRSGPICCSLRSLLLLLEWFINPRSESHGVWRVNPPGCGMAHHESAIRQYRVCQAAVLLAVDWLAAALVSLPRPPLGGVDCRARVIIAAVDLDARRSADNHTSEQSHTEERIFAYDLSRSIPPSLRHWMKEATKTLAPATDDRIYVFGADERSGSRLERRIECRCAKSVIQPEKTNLENLAEYPALAAPPRRAASSCLPTAGKPRERRAAVAGGGCGGNQDLSDVAGRAPGHRQCGGDQNARAEPGQ